MSREEKKNGRRILYLEGRQEIKDDVWIHVGKKTVRGVINKAVGYK